VPGGVDGVGVGLVCWFPGFPKNAYAPTEITIMAIMAIAANNVLFDFLRLTGGLLFLLGVMSGSSTAFHIRFFHNFNTYSGLNDGSLIQGSGHEILISRLFFRITFCHLAELEKWVYLRRIEREQAAQSNDVSILNSRIAELQS
jgi:hypothetical protein